MLKRTASLLVWHLEYVNLGARSRSQFERTRTTITINVKGIVPSITCAKLLLFASGKYHLREQKYCHCYVLYNPVGCRGVTSRGVAAFASRVSCLLACLPPSWKEVNFEFIAALFVVREGIFYSARLCSTLLGAMLYLSSLSFFFYLIFSYPLIPTASVRNIFFCKNFTLPKCSRDLKLFLFLFF